MSVHWQLMSQVSFARSVWLRLPLKRLMRSPDCVQQPAWNFRLSSHWQSNLHEDILCRHVRRNVVFNRSTCDDENCTLVDNVLTNRLVTTLARNRAGRIFVYFVMEHCVRLIRGQLLNNTDSRMLRFLSLATASGCIFR